MYRKQRPYKNDYASCMGRRYGKSRRDQIWDRKQTNLSIAKRNYRKNLWNSQRAAWFPLYTIHRKSTDGNESRAYLCMHEFEKTGKDPGKTRLEHSQIFVDFEENKNKSFKNSLDKLLPKKIIPVVIMLTRISEDKKVNEITKEERKKLVDTLKDFRMTLTGLRGFNEAIITQGGVNVKEINPSTMESKIVSNVFFAGEVLDVDAVTGGFNLQVAWSTGYAAGNN